MIPVLLVAMLLLPWPRPGPMEPLLPKDVVMIPINVVTVYHATAEQTDENPLETADGTLFSTAQIEGGLIRIAAVSQELLWWRGGPVRYGDYLWVDIDDQELAGWWQVHDTMWDGVADYVDLLVPLDVLDCWVADDADVLHPEGCHTGLVVYHVPSADCARREPSRGVEENATRAFSALGHSR